MAANLAAHLDVGETGEMLDQLKLRRFFGLVAADPVTVMQVFAPEGIIVGADNIIVFRDFRFFVGAGHGSPLMAGRLFYLQRNFRRDSKSWSQRKRAGVTK